MTNKEIFLREVDELIKDIPDAFTNEALDYIDSLRKTLFTSTPLTENGKKILIYMQSIDNIYRTSKLIGDGMGLSSRSVSGSMRKLIEEGYIEKEGSPSMYRLTEKGLSYSE